MSAKPDLSAPAPGLHNVVVYVSNDNFAQAYSVDQQQQQQQPSQQQTQQQNATVLPTYQKQQKQDYGTQYFAQTFPPPIGAYNNNNNNQQLIKNFENDTFIDNNGYVTVINAESRCDSARSETAESSCSSLSSENDAHTSNDVMYDASATVNSARNSVVHHHHHHQQQQHQQQYVLVPYGWKRILNNGTVVYISPSNAALGSPEQVKSYLLTSGTCKCGLECHFKYDSVFNFDPKVGSKPWAMTPDGPGDLTKLCNHKRKILSMASMDCKRQENDVKLRKEYNIKRKKRKIGLPYSPTTGGVSVSQILAHREKLALNQHNYSKDAAGNQQVWQQQQQQNIIQNRVPSYQEQMQNHHLIQPRIMEQQQQQQQQQMIVNDSNNTVMIQQQNGNQMVHQQQIIAPNGQLINVQSNNTMQNIVQQQQQQQQRIFVNNCDNRQLMPGQDQMFANQQHYQMQYDKVNGFRMPNHGQIVTGQQQKILWQNRLQQQQQQQQKLIHERVPPLHQPASNLWQEEMKRKKVKMNKIVKNYPCPNVDVRQIPGDVIVNNQIGHNQTSSSPSFMEDPSGYLAQQTALLNNTINRQTGTNFVCTSPKPQLRQKQILMPQVADSSMVVGEYNSHCQGCNVNRSRPNSAEDPVTSSNYLEKNSSPDTRPIQGGTVSTSNVSPIETDQPSPHAPTPPQRIPDAFMYPQQQYQLQQCCSHVHTCDRIPNSNVVTTMASGRTVGSNTITSVLAGRTNTATVSINSPAPTSGQGTIAKSPLEMVQSVVSSIQVPNSHQQHQVVKHSPNNLPPGHILVSSNGQLIMANNGGNVMAPPPPKITSMPPISVSPMVTNVTASVAQVIPAVAAQQVLGQQTVLVNALPAPFVLQPGGVTMTMDGMQNVQIPQLMTTGNVIQQQIQIDNTDSRRIPQLLSPETKNKKGKKRKMPQTVAGMLHIAAQQNSNVVMQQNSFPQQIQMAHSPQGLTTTPVMQALTIVPGKAGTAPQIVMNNGAQQLITNSQPVNLLQPVNLINGTTGVVQNFPIQQFIVPNLGGMVMNPDGTATILQDTTNLGMQLQIQNVNGQNVLTQVQNNQVFNAGQNILAAGPAGMVIRAPAATATAQNKIIQQQHSPGAAAQFLSPNGGQFVVNNAQFNSQLSPLVANVSPSQQVAFSASPRGGNGVQQAQQEYIQMNGQMGQTLMVPCAPAVTSSNTTFVQQNTTIVQQQTTMVANQQNFQQNNQQSPNQSNMSRTATLNVDQQNYIISSNDNKQMQTIVVQQQQQQRESPNYRQQSVSTQTAVNQNVTTNTFCQTSTISSPPDTTTMSPLASGGQSPPTADTTTHTGSTDDGLSPAPSNCSIGCADIMQNRPGSCTMAMVHCISSSEPDSADLSQQIPEQHDWRRSHQMSATPKPDYVEIKKSTPTHHVAFTESIAGLQYVADHHSLKQQEMVVSSRNYEKFMQQKRKSADTLVVVEGHRMHRTLFEDDEVKNEAQVEFVVGDLVWGRKNRVPWPGKIINLNGGAQATVKWFGIGNSCEKIDVETLKSLSQGLDEHHRERNKSRISRKLNAKLEKAVEEAMSELDGKNDVEKARTKRKK